MEYSVTVPVLASLAGAETPNMFFVALMGICTVLIGLTCIIFLCLLMSWLCRRFSKDEAYEKEKAPAAPAAPAASAAQPAVSSAPIPNRSELIAAVSAAVAEELGTDVSAIRIRSFKRVGAAAPAADPARGELVAAIAAAAAEELGADVSAIRIHSLKKIG